MGNGFGQWLKVQIRHTDLTWHEFEQSSGISSGRLQAWTSGKSLPRLQAYIELCEALSKNQGRLFTTVVLEGLSYLPEYRYAIKRLDQ